MTARLACAALAALAACRPTPGPAPGARADAPPTDPFTPIARLDGPTFIEIQEVVASRDGRVFYCSAVRGFQIVDARDPAAMTTRAELRPSLGSPRYPRCQHVAIDGDTAYITNRGDEIQKRAFVAAFDLAASPPREIATFARAGASFESVAVAHGRLYLAAHRDGVIVLERARAELRAAGQLATRNAWGVTVAGDLLLVADGEHGLVVARLDDPDRPTVVGRVELGGAARHVVVAGAYAYVAAGSGGLVVVDLADPSRPTVRARRATPGSALHAALAAGRLYLADWIDVRVYDLASPAEPELVATERIATGDAFPRVLGIAARDDVAFIGEWTGLYAYRFHPGRRAPDLTIVDTRVDFGEAAAGATELVPLGNEGTMPLALAAVDVTGPFAIAGDAPRAIDPGGNATLSIAYRGGSTPARGSVVIRSNDPDEPTRELALSANEPGAGVGQAAPEVEVALLGGGTFELSAQRGKVVLLAYFATF